MVNEGALITAINDGRRWSQFSSPITIVKITNQIKIKKPADNKAHASNLRPLKINHCKVRSTLTKGNKQALRDFGPIFAVSYNAYSLIPLPHKILLLKEDRKYSLMLSDSSISDAICKLNLPNTGFDLHHTSGSPSR
jgi:hypothetical protein